MAIYTCKAFSIRKLVYLSWILKYCSFTNTVQFCRLTHANLDESHADDYEDNDHSSVSPETPKFSIGSQVHFVKDDHVKNGVLSSINFTNRAELAIYEIEFDDK